MTVLDYPSPPPKAKSKSLWHWLIHAAVAIGILLVIAAMLTP